MAYKLQKSILKQRCGNKCMLCRRKLKDKECTFHHIIPKSCGGDSSLENGAILCSQCQSIVHIFNYGEEGYSKITEVIKKNKSKSM